MELAEEVILKAAGTLTGGPDEETVEEYLRKLLAALWEKEDMFSGKRPFGNSGWKWDIYKPLIEAGLTPGALDEDGDVKDLDHQGADALVQAVIARMTVREILAYR